jgi:hypothetical protein
MRTVKQDVQLLKDIRDELISSFQPDTISTFEMEALYKFIGLVFENQNKWLLSDKISSEKQSRMDQYHKEVGTTSGGEESSPTDRQIKYATMLGINVEGKSRKEVSDLIDRAKKTETRK